MKHHETMVVLARTPIFAGPVSLLPPEDFQTSKNTDVLLSRSPEVRSSESCGMRVSRGVFHRRVKR